LNLKKNALPFGSRLNGIGGLRIVRFYLGLFSGLLAASCASLALSDASSLIGKPAPDFSLKTLDDRQVKLSDLKGNVVVLDFWATWCPSCRESLPWLDKMSGDESLADRGLRVVAIDCGESKETAKGYLEKNNLSLPVGRDEDGALGNAYRIHSLPVTVVVGRDGSIRNVFSPLADGSANEAEVESAVERAFAESGG
jgi:peroxiredoxin